MGADSRGTGTFMSSDMTSDKSGARFLLTSAAAVIVVAGLRAGAPVLLPFSVAAFLAMMSLPVMFQCQRRLPSWAAIVVTLLVTVSVFTGLVLIGTQSVSELQPQLPRYQAGVQRLWSDFTNWLTARGLGSEEYLQGLAQLDPDRIFDFVGGTVRQVAGFFSSAFLVFLIMAFMLAEATVFPFKFRAILGPQLGEGRRFNKIIKEVQAYLGVKTLVSLGTGLAIGLFAWVLKLDFPILLGLIGFVLNYVPTVGSILAAIPAIVLSLIQFGTPAHAIAVGAGYLGINTLLGNMLEPYLMGRRLGLSTLVIILSLVFWGWVWGPIGAILAVPLTMVVKIMLENTEDLRWVAILLDKSPPQAQSAEDSGDVSPEVA